MLLAELIKSNPLLRTLALPFYRVRLLAGYLLPPSKQGVKWLWSSRETTNFTYDLTDKNKAYLCSTLSVVAGMPASRFSKYINELESDAELRDHVATVTEKSDLAFKADRQARFHKRLGWYALARAIKPKVIVETGVDKGLGSVVLCAALLRNREEGHEGRYFGTDLNPKAGYLLCGRYEEVGEILYGDSLESLRAMKKNIDLFINDSDHSAEYEAEEYEAILPLLSERSILIGDNSHVTPALQDFSSRNGRSFLFWKEEPLNHWYPGGGIGFCFTPPSAGGSPVCS